MPPRQQPIRTCAERWMCLRVKVRGSAAIKLAHYPATIGTEARYPPSINSNDSKGLHLAARARHAGVIPLEA